MSLVPGIIRRHMMHRPNLAKIVENIAWLLADRVLQLGVGLIISVWVARYLGPRQFGMIGFATALVGLAGPFARLGLNSIVVRDLVRDPERAGLTVGTAMVLQFAAGIVTFGLLVALAWVLRPDDALARLVIIVVASPTVLTVSNIANYWFEARVEAKYKVWINNAASILIAGVKILLIVGGASLLAFAWANAAQAALAAVGILLAFAWRDTTFRAMRASFERASVLLKDSWPLIAAGVAIAIYMKIDMVMLGQMMNDEAVGIYNAATRLSEVWYFVPIAIATSVFPSIIEAKKKSDELYYERIQQLCSVLAALALAVAIPMTFLSGGAVSLIFGAAYAAAGPILSIHIWASVFVFLGVAGGRWFIVEGRQILSMQRTALGAVVNVALNFVLIPRFGPIGAAWATVISYSVSDLFFDAIQPVTRPLFYMKCNALNVFRFVTRAF